MLIIQAGMKMIGGGRREGREGIYMLCVAIYTGSQANNCGFV